MYLDEELKRQLADRGIAAEPVPCEEITGLLDDAFPWSGSKIDWGRTSGHLCAGYGAEDACANVIRFVRQEAVWQALHLSRVIYYVNDGVLDFGLVFSPDSFLDVFAIIIGNVPLHHYFYDDKAAWCLAVTAEGYIDFAFSK